MQKVKRTYFLQLAVMVSMAVALLSFLAHAEEPEIESLRADPAPHVPAWTTASIRIFKKPSKHLTPEEQLFCTQKLLDRVNANFKTNFTQDNVVPVKMPDWDESETGFIHGGGYNIHIVGSALNHSRKHSKRIHPGRFASPFDLLAMGVVPSLHVPERVEDFKMFNEYGTGADAQVDFVAHLDTGYAYEPGGALIHLFRDIVGSGDRNPCPGRD